MQCATILIVEVENAAQTPALATGAVYFDTS
jgi:hypothetical protein